MVNVMLKSKRNYCAHLGNSLFQMGPLKFNQVGKDILRLVVGILLCIILTLGISYQGDRNAWMRISLHIL